LGVDETVKVVAYDDQGGGIAARLWYLLRAHGHPQVAVLDGGLARWTAEKRPIEAGPPRARASVPYRPRLLPGFIVSKDEVRRSLGPLLDARAPERYRGDSEPVDLRAGHIPGARNAPYSGNLRSAADPVFLKPEALRARYEAILAGHPGTPVVYCGSGVTACHDLLALELAGIPARLYPGSWSEWSADPALPIATGEHR
jgi:thiosulfate/3-mercaptopyruvate sulfurtransferase